MPVSNASFLLIFFFLAVAPLVTFATVSDADLQKEYGDKVLTLRQFYGGEHLRFDCSGNLIGTVATGIWTVQGQLRVQTVSLEGGGVHIRGERLFSFYDDETKQMRDIASVSKSEAKAKHLRKDVAQWAEHQGKVKVDIDCGQSPSIRHVRCCTTHEFRFPLSTGTIERLCSNLLEVMARRRNGHRVQEPEG